MGCAFDALDLTLKRSDGQGLGMHGARIGLHGMGSAREMLEKNARGRDQTPALAHRSLTHTHACHGGGCFI